MPPEPMELPHTGARMDRDRERTLVDRAGLEPAAFGELYDFYLPRIYGFVYRRVQERQVAEDVTATTFQRALETLRAGTFRNDAFGGWLYRVAANAVIDHLRRASRTSHQTDDAALAGDAFAEALDAIELRRAMASLPENHRSVLTLRFFDDLDPDEASAVLGCTRGTFAVRLHRALAALRAVMLANASPMVGAGDPQEATDAA